MKQFLFSTMLLSGIFFMEAQAKSSTYFYWPGQLLEATTGEQSNGTSSNKDAADYSEALMPEDPIDINANSAGSNGIVSWGSGHTHRSMPTVYFTLERSFDGREFNAIQTIAAKSSGDYSITDAGVWNTATGRVWYRLQMVDNNGNTYYSSIVELTGRPATR